MHQVIRHPVGYLHDNNKINLIVVQICKQFGANFITAKINIIMKYELNQLPSAYRQNITSRGDMHC